MIPNKGVVLAGLLVVGMARGDDKAEADAAVRAALKDLPAVKQKQDGQAAELAAVKAEQAALKEAVAKLAAKLDKCPCVADKPAAQATAQPATAQPAATPDDRRFDTMMAAAAPDQRLVIEVGGGSTTAFGKRFRGLRSAYYEVWKDQSGQIWLEAMDRRGGHFGPDLPALTVVPATQPGRFLSNFIGNGCPGGNCGRPTFYP